MLENGYKPKMKYFTYFEILKINLNNKGVNNEKSYKDNFILIAGGFILERILILKLMKMKNKKDNRFLLLASMIHYLFLDILNEKMDLNKKIPENFSDLLIEDKVLNFKGEKIDENNQKKLIFGLLSVTELRNFLNQKKKVFFRSFFAYFFNILYEKFMKCKKMIKDLEKFEPMKEKLKIIKLLKKTGRFYKKNSYSVNYYNKEYFKKN